MKNPIMVPAMKGRSLLGGTYHQMREKLVLNRFPKITIMVHLSQFPEKIQENIIKVKYFDERIYAAEPQPGARKPSS